MGKSLPPPAEIDLVLSYARRVGDVVELVLGDPQLDLDGAPPVVRLRQAGRRGVEREGRLVHDERGRRLVVRVPRKELGRGTWAVLLVGGPQGKVPVQARLLVQGRRPVVLLWGRRGSPSELPVPHPRTSTSQPVRSPIRAVWSRTPAGLRRRVRAVRAARG